MHITHGASAVLMVKPETRHIVAVTPTARTVYSADEQISLPAPLSISICVDDIFPHS